MASGEGNGQSGTTLLNSDEEIYYVATDDDGVSVNNIVAELKYVLCPIFFQPRVSQKYATYIKPVEHQGFLKIDRDDDRTFTEIVKDIFNGIVSFSGDIDNKCILIDWKLYLGRNNSLLANRIDRAKYLPLVNGLFDFPNNQVKFTDLRKTVDTMEVTNVQAARYLNIMAMWNSCVLVMTCETILTLDKKRYGKYDHVPYGDPFVVKPASGIKSTEETSEKTDAIIEKLVRSLQIPKHLRRSCVVLLEDLLRKNPQLDLALSHELNKSTPLQNLLSNQIIKLVESIKQSFDEATIAAQSEHTPVALEHLRSIRHSANGLVDILDGRTSILQSYREHTEGIFRPPGDMREYEFSASFTLTLSSVDSLYNGLKSVCMIQDAHGNNAGTGFLCAPNLIMTCFHCLYDCTIQPAFGDFFKPKANQFKFVFDEQRSITTSVSAVVFPANHSQRRFIGLDVAIVQVEVIKDIRPIKLAFDKGQAWLELQNIKHRRPSEEQHLFLLTNTKKSKLHFSSILAYRNWEVIYNHATQDGDSGSPLVNQNGLIMAIHRRRGSTNNKDDINCNVGLRIDLFLRDLFGVRMTHNKYEGVPAGGGLKYVDPNPGGNSALFKSEEAKNELLRNLGVNTV